MNKHIIIIFKNIKKLVFHASLRHQQQNTRIPVEHQIVVPVIRCCPEVHRNMKVQTPASILMASPFQPGVVSRLKTMNQPHSCSTFRFALPNRWDAGTVGPPEVAHTAFNPQQAQ